MFRSLPVSPQEVAKSLPGPVAVMYTSLPLVVAWANRRSYVAFRQLFAIFGVPCAWCGRAASGLRCALLRLASMQCDQAFACL